MKRAHTPPDCIHAVVIEDILAGQHDFSLFGASSLAVAAALAVGIVSVTYMTGN